MKRALHLVDKLSDIVQRKPWLEITEIADRSLEGPRPGGDAPALQTPAQCLVDNFTERPAGAPRFRFEVGCHIVIQGERRAHVLML
jgi:hypothetical protein